MPETGSSSLNEDALRGATADSSIPKIYANGFITGVTHGDVVILLQRNGQSVTMLNMSFTVAKTLAQKLAESITALEARTKTTIMTTEETVVERNRDAGE